MTVQRIELHDWLGRCHHEIAKVAIESGTSLQDIRTAAVETQKIYRALGDRAAPSES